MDRAAYEGNAVQILVHLPPRKRKAASLVILLFKKIINFWLHWVFGTLHRLSLVQQAGATLLQCMGCSLQWLLVDTGSRVHGLWSHTGFDNGGTLV